MSKQLYIDNELVPLPKDFNIALTIQAINIADIANRRMSHSNSIPLPNIAVVNKILGHPNIIQSNSQIPYRKIAARYIQNGITLIENGYVRLARVQDNFSVNIYYNGGDFWASVEGKTLSQLAGLSAYDHVHTKVNINTSRNNTSGMIYPFIEYGKAQGTVTLGIGELKDANKLLPGMFLHTMIDLIVTEAGYTLLGDIIINPEYLELIMPHTSTGYYDIHTIEFRGNQSALRNVFAAAGTTTLIFDAIDLFNSNFSSTTYTCDANIKNLITDPTIGISITISNYNDQGGGSTVLEIRKNGSPINSLPFGGNGSFSIFESSTSFVEGDQITIAIVHSNVAFTIDALASFNVVENEIFTMSEHVQDMQQKDLLKTVMNMFAIIPIVDDNNRTIKFVQFDEIKANKEANAYDWSDKIDLDKPVEVQYRLPNYSQLNWLRYKPNNDARLDDIYDGNIAINDEILKSEGDLFVLPFAGTHQFTSPLSPDLIAQIPLYDGLEHDGILPRILRMNKKSGSTLYRSAEVDETITTNIPFCHFVNTADGINLSFNGSDNMITKHYSAFSAMLQNLKLIAPHLTFTELDIKNMDTTRPVFIEFYNSYFWINGVKNYIENKSTLIQLIQIK